MGWWMGEEEEGEGEGGGGGGGRRRRGEWSCENEEYIPCPEVTEEHTSALYIPT